jgi:hypothetical protein
MAKVTHSAPKQLDERRLRFSNKELKDILGVIRDDGSVKLDDWFVVGIPAPDVDGIGGSFTVKPAAMRGVIERLLRNPKIKLEIFPYGIVNPDRFRVDFRSKGL